MHPTAGDYEYHKGFADRPWQVHKFGGTSVATADCFRACANIIEDRLQDHHETNIAVVVSAMGGKPKTTDLLLDSVKAAAQRDLDQVESLLGAVLSKHEVCLKQLFGDSSEYTRLVGIVKKDLDDIRDILKTVSLMKWQASRIRK
jgi:aspartokinase/homoserine dehydrogenase 1